MSPFFSLPWPILCLSLYEIAHSRDLSNRKEASPVVEQFSFHSWWVAIMSGSSETFLFFISNISLLWVTENNLSNTQLSKQSKAVCLFFFPPNIEILIGILIHMPTSPQYYIQVCENSMLNEQYVWIHIIHKTVGKKVPRWPTTSWDFKVCTL